MGGDADDRKVCVSLSKIVIFRHRNELRLRLLYGEIVEEMEKDPVGLWIMKKVKMDVCRRKLIFFLTIISNTMW